MRSLYCCREKEIGKQGHSGRDKGNKGDKGDTFFADFYPELAAAAQNLKSERPFIIGNGYPCFFEARIFKSGIAKCALACEY
ncbi:MAG: hypothetical protein A2Z88_11335 [Omnitrophica WOR_2 bacterium GWA2_47_8]|nr:MAG: hypothetical protein A2Z88_11335 [Omnitrophica WOR_2 bacterium GWA2_47_8]